MDVPAKTPGLKSVLSASRRTDIPAFYIDWFMTGIDKGCFEVTNPYNGQKRRVSATTDTIHSIVFWSKNFGPFIRGNYGERLKQKGFHLFYNFTINSESKLLEPNVPSLSERLQQLSALTDTESPERISWRFDPICHFRLSDGKWMDNLSDFDQIAEYAARCGISRCITSFMDNYSKIRKRTERRGGISFIEVSNDHQTEILERMQSRLKPLGIQLQLCCEQEVLRSLPETLGIESASCISSDLLMRLFGGELSLKRDNGQRVSAGCGCKVSIDIGGYEAHPCFHNCLYCYANPTMAVKEAERTQTGPEGH
jgi:hypothetical protein